MIIRDKPKAWELLFVLRGSVLPQIAPRIGFITVLSIGVVVFEHIGLLKLQAIAALPFSLMGIALSIFAGFRNSVCYDRWWEGRKVFGQLLVDARSLARQAVALLGLADALAARRVGLRCIAFSYALKDQMRGIPLGPEALAALDPAEASFIAARRHGANMILLRLSEEIAAGQARAILSPQTAATMEERVVSLSAVLAAGERIRSVPVPFAYSLLLHRTAYLFCLLLPFGLAAVTEFWTPLVVAIVCYTFFGLDALGDELEAPFGRGQNALPLDAITRGLEIDIRECSATKPCRPTSNRWISS